MDDSPERDDRTEAPRRAPRLGYVMNTYPVPSATFIRREIAAHEAAGHPVHRYAVRPWDGVLVDPADQAEAERMAYLLPQGALRLGRTALAEAVANPAGMARALATMLELTRRARRRAWVNLAYLVEAATLKRWALAHGIEHLHAHYSTNAAAVALLAHRLGGPGYSFTVHGPDELPDLAANGIAAKARHARAVVAITEHCRSVIQAALETPQEIDVVPCGIDLADFAEGAAPAGADFVCVGRLCPQKAQTDLVAAFAQVPPPARLRLIGDGETRGEIEAEIRRLGLEDRVALTGWGDGATVRAAIGGAQALVLASHAEGLPIVIMEALALGRPVIATRIAGIPELLDESCGWIVPPGDTVALAKAMRACLAATPEMRARLGAEGRRRVAARHDVHRTAAALRALFAERGP